MDPSNRNDSARVTGRTRSSLSGSKGKVKVTPTPQDQRTARKVRPVFFRRQLKGNEASDLADALTKLKVSEPSPVYDFDDMKLKPELLKGILAHGMEKPAVCQQNVIMPMIQGRDIICQAQSGMGKTAAFCISILQRLDPNDPKDKALVLAPTRELAEQIIDEFRAFAKFMKIKILPCIGGIGKFKTNMVNAAKGNFHIAVGTIGRICHLFSMYVEDKNGVYTRVLDGDTMKMFVIDEADKMLMERSFRGELEDLFMKLSPRTQIIVTSATMPSVAFDRCHEVMRDPFEFLLRTDQLTLDGIRQFHIKVGDNAGKLTTMDELFPYLKQKCGITFCNTRKGAEILTKEMKNRNHVIEGMVGTMEQDVRTTRYQDFKSGRVPVLIASDLLGRGVDIHHVQLVINYDIPKDNEQYIHRIGRAGRYGKKGVAITFVMDSELEKITELEGFYHTVIPELRARIGDLMDELN